MQHGKFRQLILENRYRCHKYPQHRPNMYIKIQMPGTFKPVLDKVLYWAHTHELNIKQDKIPQFIACMKYMGLACPAYGELAKLGGFDGGFWPNQNSFDKEVAKQPELAGKKPLRLVEDLKSSPCWKLTREYDFKLHDNQHFSPDTSKKENSKLVGTAEMVPDHIKRKVDNQEKKEQSAKSYNQHWQSVQDQQLAQRHHVPMMPAQSLPIQAGLQAPPRPVQSFEVSSGPPTIPPSFQAAPPSISTGNPPLLNSSPSVSSVPRPGSNQLSNTMAQYQQQQKQDTPDIFAMQQQIQQQQAMLTQLQQNISQPINEPGRKRKSKKEKRREEAFRQREARILSSNPAPMPVSMPPVAAPTSTAIGYGPPTLNFGRPSEAVGFKSFDQVSNQPANDPVPEKRPRTHSAWTDIKDQNVIKSMGWGTVPTSNTWRTNANMESSEKQALPSWGSASSTGAFNQGFKSNIMSGLSNGNRQPPDTHSNGWDRV